MDKSIRGYLFAHFTGETPQGEQVYFSLSGDGLHWQDLNSGQPVLCSDIGERGVRDPFLLRSVLDGQYYLIATDLRIANGKGWGVAQRAGSTRLILWKSADLLHWSAPWSFDTRISGAGCAWAPEAIYDPAENAYLVFWAARVQEPGEADGKHRIYAAHTGDFVRFTPPAKYIERAQDVIDTTIVEDQGVFYRFSKDETNKNIVLDCGAALAGGFKTVDAPVLSTLMGVEGPAAFRLKDGRWCLLVDQFAAGKGYMPLVCDDLAGGVFAPLPESAYSMGAGLKRHGSVLPLNAEEFARVGAHYKAEK